MRSLFSAAILASTLAVVSANYDPVVGTRAMYYSGAAYCDKGTLDSWTCGEPCTELGGLSNFLKVENEVLDTFGFIGYNAKDNEVVLSFRGTNGADFLNWMTNIVYYRVQYADVPNTQVHSGFYTAYNAVSNVIINALRPLFTAHPDATFLLTGHSLGGALATFAALDIKRRINPPNKFNFYSFGSPRTGNQAFTDYVMSLFPSGGYQRVTHYTDVVVQIPPRQMGFNHAGNEVWYYNSSGLDTKVCENNQGALESTACADSYIFTTGIDAHLTYLDKPISRMCTVNGMPEPELLAEAAFAAHHPPQCSQ